MNLLICYPKCSTCSKAEKYLNDHNVKYEYRDIKLNNPSKLELKRWIKESGLDIKKFFNTSGLKYRELDLKNRLSSMNEEEKLDLLASDGMLVKRPILIAKMIVVGFKEESYSKVM